ncbi:glycosyl hydrolase [uncultured Draconibacterium sp.]|uniref:glycosyl hydrolase n=1 Tax=uncultured Draconibacterium sp. TaxID=1573823 RepID=UPI0029C8A5DF|nr:glycosyl hydrolase [uncultured Draconibacterium sp.]
MRTNHLLLLLTLTFLSAVFIQCAESSNENSAKFEEGFMDPPKEARPRVWWHWMNGNVTKDGITKDLLWMKKSGIGGFQNFDAGLMTPQIVDKRLTYMTPEWKDAFKYATNLADSLDLEMAIAGSPGWSQTGGPWVEPKDGMKKLVWRELCVQGNQLFNEILPEPYTTSGTFQNIPMSGEMALTGSDAEQAPEYYQDVAVLAYRLPENDIKMAQLNPKVSSSGGTFKLAQLSDGDLAATQLLPVTKKEDYAWILFEFPQAQTIRSISIVGGGVREQWGALPPPDTRNLQVSDNGKDFRDVCTLPLGGVEQQTIAIPETTAKYFRINFQNPSSSEMSSIAAAFGGQMEEVKGTEIAEIVLSPMTRINHAEEKAGFAAEFDLNTYPTPETNDVIDQGTVVNLTEKMNEDGTLQWNIPEGKWKIIRFGYSLTGKENHPASPEATGLEVDKIDGRAVRDYFNNYLDQYKDATGGLMGVKGLHYIITDSYEAGQMTWTPLMAQEFETRRGYSVIPWLPVLTGEIIESSEASEKFLWDWRKTIGEMIAEYHYDQLTDILAERGMARYTESHENGRLYLVDGMDAKRKAAVPMSAMWVPGGAGSSLAMAQADIRESASVAHIYGKKYVAAESLTAMGLMGNAWSYFPENLKPTADLELANGLNRFVIHTSVHQPVDDKIPGLGLMIFGQWFNRHETWSEQAKAWTDYLARSSYLLQQGNFVADVVYFYGEDNNITGLFGHQLPDIPKGYNFDFINPDALINLLSVENGKLVTPGGMKYQILALDDNTKTMSLPVLRKLAKLANEGAVIVGSRPVQKAGMQGDEEEFKQLVDEIWNTGKSTIRENESMEQVLSSLNLNPDFSYSADNDLELLNVHRKVGNTDIYWVNNRSNDFESVKATFRVAGKKPEIWHPETGDKEDVSYTIANGMTTVTLDLTPNDAVFVVFDQTTKEKQIELPKGVEKEIQTIEGPWDIAFQPERGAPASTTFDKLESYTENADNGIKYFSGTATYTNTFQLTDADILSGKLSVDLGDVKNLAEVTVNGKNLGVIWKKPFIMDISDAAQPGENKLEVKVINLWVNRLIGDLQPDATEKITYTTMPFYQANSPLLTSGLLGPVKVIAAK